MSEATLFERPVEACLEAGRAQVERLAEERQRRDPGVNERERSARERALAFLSDVQAVSQGQDTASPSPTDT